MRATRLPRRRASVLIRTTDEEPLFYLTIYGVTTEDLCTVPGGGNVVAEALRRRGLTMMEDVHVSLFDVDVKEETLYKMESG